MISSNIRNIRLLNEVDNSVRLIKKGFSELQHINCADTPYHIPILLISSGFERLMKCIICYWHLKKNKKYPSNKRLRELGHRLDILLQEIVDICKQFGNYDNRKATTEDLDFLKNNKRLHNIIRILSEFADGGRYYNLDIVSQGNSEYSEPEDKWREFETEIIKEDPEFAELIKNPAKSDEMYDKINKVLMTYLERFARALSRIFTLGELHPDAKRCYSYISDFLNIMDKDLGVKKY